MATFTVSIESGDVDDHESEATSFVAVVSLGTLHMEIDTTLISAPLHVLIRRTAGRWATGREETGEITDNGKRVGTYWVEH